MSETTAPDLTGAEVYVETNDPPIAGGSWYIVPGPEGERVIHQSKAGEFKDSVVPASSLRGSPSWTRSQQA